MESPDYLQMKEERQGDYCYQQYKHQAAYCTNHMDTILLKTAPGQEAFNPLPEYQTTIKRKHGEGIKKSDQQVNKSTPVEQVDDLPVQGERFGIICSIFCIKSQNLKILKSRDSVNAKFGFFETE